MTMTTPPISRWPVPDPAGLPDDIRQRIDEVQEKAGFVPNVFLTLAQPESSRGVRTWSRSPVRGGSRRRSRNPRSEPGSQPSSRFRRELRERG